MTDFNYEDRIKEVELFNKWADFEGLDIKMSSETEHSSKETHLAFLAWIAAKAQAVPENHLLIPRDKVRDLVTELEMAFEANLHLTIGDLLPLQQDLKVILETSESGAEG